MTDPQQLADHAWKDAEALVRRIEQATQSDIPDSSFFAELAAGLRLTAGASSVVISVEASGNQDVLAHAGIAIHHQGEESALPKSQSDHRPQGYWSDTPPPGGDRLQAVQRVVDDVRVGIDLRFDHPVELALRQTLCDLAEVMADFASTVFLRSRFESLRSEVQLQSDRDQLIRRLNQGVGLTESFTSIAAAIASQTRADRVILLRFDARRPRIVAASTHAKVDRRARSVRLLASLVSKSLELGDSFSFTVGSPSQVSPELGEVLDKYLQESGCRQIHIRSIDAETPEDQRSGRRIAAMVLESFRLSSDQSQSVSTRLTPIERPVQDAVRNAVHRDDGGWGLLLSRFANGASRRKSFYLVVALLAFAVACLMPATLKIPAEGHIVASQRSRLFAPIDAVVTRVVARNGQKVRQGDLLVVLNSPSLDLLHRDVRGELATAQARLDSLLALRTRGDSNRSQASDVSTDEQVLKAEIAGLRDQLRIIEAQQESLTIRSTIDGTVDRWDLERSLTARPVTQGQHLLDVLSADRGWTVELDLPEQHINYVLDQPEACRCVFRIRSNPTKIYEGVVNHVTATAQVNHQGKSIVRVTVPITEDSEDEFRSGATVVAQLECGKRSIGFVVFRGLIQWCRSHAWY